MQRQQSGGVRAGCCPVGHETQRTVEQSTFFALEPLLSVVVPVVVPVVPASVLPVVPLVVPGVVPVVPWVGRLAVSGVLLAVVSPRFEAQAQSTVSARIPANFPALFISSSFRS
jgi:predicted Na+-dependent transporter